jgi:hypothetical protein
LANDGCLVIGMMREWPPKLMSFKFIIELFMSFCEILFNSWRDFLGCLTFDLEKKLVLTASFLVV